MFFLKKEEKKFGGFKKKIADFQEY